MIDQVITPPVVGNPGSSYFFVKRLIDTVLATLLLIFLSPLLLVIAILIKLDSPGPVIFVQSRVGAKRQLAGRHRRWEIQTFRIYKFRSMYSDADQALHQAHIRAYTLGQLEITNASTPTFKLTDDPRVTRVGRILRKTSLDELPQLVNVLKGEMGLVGPRPIPVYEFEDYQERHKQRFAALPGITGLWQVKGRCLVSFEEQIQMDIEYVRNQSLWLDLKILLLTIPAVLSGRGAG